MKILLEILSTLSGMIQFLGYIVYGTLVFRKYIKANTGSWMIWAFGNLLVCFTYMENTESIYQEVLPFVCSISCLVLVVVFLFFKKFNKPTWYEYLFFGVDFLISIYWFFNREVYIVHIIFDLSAVISFIPIYIEIYNDPTTEKKEPWLIWSFAYFLLIIISLIEKAELVTFLYPISYFILHIIIVYILNSRNKKRLQF